jgi:hypothetical protein
MAVTDYNATASNNTAISGINIAEGCPPGNVNNAIRQMMADLADYNTKVTGGTTVAGKATRLATARTITVNPAGTAAASFDGSANISVGVAPNLTDGAAASTLPTAGTATALTTLLNTVRNCLKWLVARFDSSGNANAALKWATARTIAISGGATGTATSINGTANITIPVTALDVSKATAGTLSVDRGGTGQTSLAAVRNALGLGTALVAVAPMPQTAAGVGQWKKVSSTTTSIALPSGGTWAVLLIPVWLNSGGLLTDSAAQGDSTNFPLIVGIYAGGTSFTNQGGRAWTGMVWRIA